MSARPASPSAWRRLAAGLLAAVAAAAAPGQGGGGPPRLAYVFPAGAAAGATATVHVGGLRLTDTVAARFSDPGLVARVTGHERPLTQKEAVERRERARQLREQRDRDRAAFPATAARELAELESELARRNPNPRTPALAETVALEVTVPPGTPPGVRELRLRTPAGLSNALVFEIGSLPETTAPAVTATSAGRRGGPAAATPRPAPLPVALPAIVNGQILPGEVDSVRFTARRGQVVTAAVSARSLIPYLADAVPGWFQAVLRLRDAAGREIAFNDDHEFRPDPVLACTIPADGDYTLEIHDALFRGREDFVYRLALGELPLLQAVYPLGAPRGRTTAVELSGWNLPRPRLDFDPGPRPTGTFLLAVSRDGQRSNPLHFAVLDRVPAWTEGPADTAPPGPLPCPAEVDARIARPGEEDAFIVRARAGERLVAEIVARRLDSPLDARLELRGPDGRPMARNDDWEDPSEGLLTHHADPRLEFTAPTTGDYRLAVTDAQGRGGPGFAYRLVLRPLTPDFALRVTPSAVNIPAGGTATVMVHVLRKDGFTGAVALELAGDRHRLDGGRVPSDVSALPVTITAAPSLAPGTVTPLVLTGRAEIAGLPVTRTAGPCDDTMQAFLWRHLVPAAGWLACATARGPQLQADDTATLRLRPGTTTTVRVRPATRAGPVERPTAELIGAPAGVTVAACRTRGPDIEVDLAVAADLPDGPRAGNIVLLLSGARPARAGGGTPPARPLGVVPARPCELVAPQPRAAG